MLHDELLKLQETVTKTGAFSGQTLDIRGGVASGSALFAEVLYSAGTASSSGSAKFTTQESDDNATFSDLGSQTVNLTTDAAQGVVYVPVVTSKRYVRLSVSFSGGGATITYAAFLVMGKPN